MCLPNFVNFRSDFFAIIWGFYLFLKFINDADF